MVRRVVVIVLAANALIWLAFLFVTAPLTQTEFAAIEAERSRRDADPGIDLMTHEPIIVAARRLEPRGPGNSADRLLQITALPALQLFATLTVPADYGTTLTTRRESHIIAAGAFVLSTAFWSAVGVLIGWFVAHVRFIRTRRPAFNYSEATLRAMAEVTVSLRHDRALAEQPCGVCGAAFVAAEDSGSRVLGLESGAQRFSFLMCAGCYSKWTHGTTIRVRSMQELG